MEKITTPSPFFQSKGRGEKVDSECPEIVTFQDRPFSGLHKAGVPLAVCMHLTEKGLSRREAVWTASQSRSGLSFTGNKLRKWSRAGKR